MGVPSERGRRRNLAPGNASKPGRFAIVEQLLADGITYMFGNPGTVEQGFLDALGEYPAMRYITTLQETIAVGVADGYARATRQPTLVQLHTGVGLGNGIGMMYQAKRGNAPLVVIAGESGIRYDSMDAQMAADLVSMARPVTKWSTRVVDPSSTLRVLRKAVKIAATPPCGPVFVALPMDVLDAESDEPVFPTSLPDTRVAPTGRGDPRRRGDARGRGAADRDRRRRDRVVGRAGRAHPRRGAARRGGVGRELRRGRHRLDAPALPRPARAHVRRALEGDHVRRRTPC